MLWAWLSRRLSGIPAELEWTEKRRNWFALVFVVGVLAAAAGAYLIDPWFGAQFGLDRVRSEKATPPLVVLSICIVALVVAIVGLVAVDATAADSPAGGHAVTARGN